MRRLQCLLAYVLLLDSAKSLGQFMATFQEGAVNHLTRRGSSVEPGASNTDSLVTVLIQELDNCNGLLEVGLRPARLFVAFISMLHQ